MSRDKSATSNEAEVRAVVDRMVEAVRANDLDSLLALIADDIVTFDMVPPLQLEAAAVRRAWADTLEKLAAPIEYEVEQLHVAAGDDVAFCRSVNLFAGTWIRATLGLRKIRGHWKIVHEHVSVPFDMNDGKALLQLKP